MLNEKIYIFSLHFRGTFSVQKIPDLGNFRFIFSIDGNLCDQYAREGSLGPYLYVSLSQGIVTMWGVGMPAFRYLLDNCCCCARTGSWSTARPYQVPGTLYVSTVCDSHIIHR